MRFKAGYTLIEILVVLVIISIVTSMALLTIGRSKHRQVKALTSDLVQMISLAQERAILQPAVLALQVDKQAIQVFIHQKSQDAKAPAWQLLTDSQGLAKRSIPQGIYVRVDVANSDQPRIIISGNGELTPFTMYVGEEDEKPGFRIIGQADGGVTHEEL